MTTFIDKGSYGQVLKVVDRTQANRKLVIKISSDQAAFKRELKALKAVAASAAGLRPAGEDVRIPEVVEHGLLFYSAQLQSNNNK